jgi:ubiquinone/menaquinone biosynthesis C-methylase UbiE
VVELVCPECKTPLQQAGNGLRCLKCQRSYTNNDFLLEIDFPNINTWNTLQEHGILSYNVDPNNNLSVDYKRQDVAEFAKFCTLRGTILDIGCGPQPVPAYAYISPDSEYYGIDPIMNDTKYYHFIRAYCEALPFADNSFDIVIFATSLDHVIDVNAALKEVQRVLKDNGKVFLWQGLKSTNYLARIAGYYKEKGKKEHYFISPDSKPESAADVFHQKRFSDKEIRELFTSFSFKLIRKKVFRPDILRYNLFYEFEKTQV